MRRIKTMIIDTTNLCSHLQKKLFQPNSVYYHIWQAIQDDEELTATVTHDSYTSTAMERKYSFLQGKLSQE